MALKDNLLQYLSEHCGNLYSGEFLAEQFHVTRAAVWKSMKQLISEGYQIEAHGGQGYIFSKENDTLNKNTILQYSGCTDIPIVLLETIDSTNSYARILLAQQCQDGTYIIANEQTTGRGRQGHSFFSPANTGLYVSYILHTNDQAENLLKLTLAAAVAVCETIEECTGLDPQIKWVNDIYLNRKKIAGILTEATFDFETQHVDSVIIGIGINVQTTDFPEDIREIAGALLKNDISRNQIAGVLYKKLQDWIVKTNSQELMNAYRTRSLLPGKQISYTRNGQIETGIVTGINDSGNLVIKKDSQEIILSSGEVHILSWD